MTERESGAQALTVAEVAELLGISTAHAYETIRTTHELAGLKPIRIGRFIRFGRKAVEAVLAGEVAQ